MNPLPEMAALGVIAVVWLTALLIAQRWCERIGVHERPCRLAIALVIPTASLIFSVHLLALFALFADSALVSPKTVAPVFLMVAAAFARIVGFAPTPAPNVATASASSRKGMGIWRLCVVLILGMYAVFLTDAVTRFPIGYDALHYHLPVALQWMRAGRLDLTVGLSHESFPENGMVVPFLIAFSGVEQLFDTAHFFNALLAVLATYGLTRAAGIGHRASTVAACIAAAVPMVVFQSVSCYIDLYAASFWLTSLLAITLAARSSQASSKRALLVLAGLAAGLALGSKPTYLVLVFLLGVIVVGSRWIQSKSHVQRVRHALAAGIVFASACLPCSFFWFARGTAQTGNPIYPVSVEFDGHPWLPGFTSADFPQLGQRPMTDKLHRWWHYPWTETKYSGVGYPAGRGSGLGATYTTLVPIGMAMVLFGVIRRIRRGPPGRDAPSPWAITYLALGVTGFALLITVFREMLRFVLPLVLVLVPLSGLVIERTVRSFPRVAPALVILALLVTTAVSTLQPAHLLATRLRDGTWNRARFYGVPSIVDELPEGSRILNLASAAATYPLAGRRLQNRPITPLHWRLLSKDQPLSMTLLREHGIDYVYATADQAERWPADLPVVPVGNQGESPGMVLGLPSLLFKVIASQERVADSQDSARAVGRPG